MTKISYIHGIPEDEIKDRAKEVPAPNRIDFGGMTEGELKLSLLNEQLQILSSFYPEVGEYQKAKQEVSNALYKGIHGPVFLSGVTTDITRYNIANARKLAYPSIQVNGFGLGGPEKEKCSEYGQFKRNWLGNIRFVGDMEKYLACQQRNDFIDIFNAHLEKSGHHILYNYLSDVNTSPQIVTSKSLLHSLAVDKLAIVSGLSKANIETWMRNGIMRNNATNGTEPLQPEETIAVFAEGSRIGIGVEPVSATIVITKAIVAAIGAIIALVSSMKPDPREEFKGTLNNIGLESFGPGQEDWRGTEGSMATNTETDYLPWLVGGAALLLIK